MCETHQLSTHPQQHKTFMALSATRVTLGLISLWMWKQKRCGLCWTLGPERYGDLPSYFHLFLLFVNPDWFAKDLSTNILSPGEPECSGDLEAPSAPSWGSAAQRWTRGGSHPGPASIVELRGVENEHSCFVSEITRAQAPTQQTKPTTNPTQLPKTTPPHMNKTLLPHQNPTEQKTSPHYQL